MLDLRWQLCCFINDNFWFSTGKRMFDWKLACKDVPFWIWKQKVRLPPACHWPSILWQNRFKRMKMFLSKKILLLHKLFGFSDCKEFRISSTKISLCRSTRRLMLTDINWYAFYSKFVNFIRFWKIFKFFFQKKNQSIYFRQPKTQVFW